MFVPFALLRKSSTVDFPQLHDVAISLSDNPTSNFYLNISLINTETAVKMPDLVDPLLNISYNEMAAHYGTTIVPAMASKPKDKVADENTVKNISQRIIAALRNYRFFSIYEINEAIRTELKN